MTPTFDCQSCGACCREAYHAVEVHRRERFVKTHPEWLEARDGRLNIRRVEGRCACLSATPPYTCVVYADRPKTCRDFEVGSANCLEARRRVGISA